MLIESSGKNSKFNEREILRRQNHTFDIFMSGLDWAIHRRHIQIIHFYFDGILKISPNLPLCVTNDIGLSSANAGFRERYGLLLRNKNTRRVNLLFFHNKHVWEQLFLKHTAAPRFVITFDKLMSQRLTIPLSEVWWPVWSRHYDMWGDSKPDVTFVVAVLFSEDSGVILAHICQFMMSITRLQTNINITNNIRAIFSRDENNWTKYTNENVSLNTTKSCHSFI